VEVFEGETRVVCPGLAGVVVWFLWRLVEDLLFLDLLFFDF
jgi:hypothetical protein